MNETHEITVPVLEGIEEILDADGNPTGQYREVTGDGETPREGTTVYTTAEDGEHEVTAV